MDGFLHDSINSSPFFPPFLKKICLCAFFPKSSIGNTGLHYLLVPVSSPIYKYYKMEMWEKLVYWFYMNLCLHIKHSFKPSNRTKYSSHGFMSNTSVLCSRNTNWSWTGGRLYFGIIPVHATRSQPLSKQLSH